MVQQIYIRFSALIVEERCAIELFSPSIHIRSLEFPHLCSTETLCLLVDKQTFFPSKTEKNLPSRKAALRFL